MRAESVTQATDMRAESVTQATDMRAEMHPQYENKVKPETLHPKPCTRSPNPCTRNPEPWHSRHITAAIGVYNVC